MNPVLTTAMPYIVLGVGGFFVLKYLGIDLGDIGTGLKDLVKKGQDFGRQFEFEPGILGDTPTAGQLKKRAEEIKAANPQAEIIALRQLFSSPNTQPKSYVLDALPKLARQEIPKFAAKYGVPRQIALAVAYQESGGNPVAVGADDDRGLFQITEIALKDFNAHYGKDYPFSAIYSLALNIEVGVKFLALQFKRMNFHYYDGIRAYNAGEQGANNGLSYDYLRDVLRHIKLDPELVEDKLLLPTLTGDLT